MKKIILLAFFVSFSALTFSQSKSIHEDYSTILKNYVIDGLVDYSGLKQNRESLDNYVTVLSNVTKSEFNSWSENDRLAFLINLYNAETLQFIIDNYPVKSIKDIGGLFSNPWKQDVVSLFGEMITLDNLEHDIIRVEYSEPKIHMVLVCAALGCPPLLNEAYEGSTLIAQLDRQSTLYLQSDKGMVIDRDRGQVFLSSIFKWYGKDFDSVQDFAENYSGENLNGLKIKWIDYDWNLNEIK